MVLPPWTVERCTKVKLARRVFWRGSASSLPAVSASTIESPALAARTLHGDHELDEALIAEVGVEIVVVGAGDDDILQVRRPPKISMPSSELLWIWMWSIVVLLPTPPSVRPCNSLPGAMAKPE